MEEFMAVGKRALRVDGIGKVTGSAKFTGDIALPGMLFGKIKRSPYAHAKIRSIDTSKAEKLSNVEAVITAKDLPPRRYGVALCDESALAVGKVRYVGDPVAAVAAVSENVAEDALDLIEVEYEELPAVFDPEEAMKLDPPAIIHEELDKYQMALPYSRPTMDVRRPNVYNYFKIRSGDVEKGFREADLVIANRFATSMIHHCYLEPYTTVSSVEPDGSVTVWTTSQAPHLVKSCLGVALGLRNARVIVPYVGGGFGGKTDMKQEAVCVALAQKTGRPVKIGFTREEAFVSTTVRQPFIIDIKDGVKKDGTILARKITLILNEGAYSEVGFFTVRSSAFGAVGTYKIPNFSLDSYGVYTNLPIGGAHRGIGSPQSIWAVESQMDIVAERLGMHPVELRLKNVLHEGDVNVTGEKMHSVGSIECLLKAAELINLGKKIETERGYWRVGRGIALGNKYSFAPTVACASVKVHEDETIEVRTGAVEIGQGTTTVLTQIAAEEFKIPMEKVKIVWADTANTPFDQGAFSSRQTFISGNAVRLACIDAKKQLIERAAKKMDANPENLESKGGEIYVKGSPERSIRIGELFTPVLFGQVLEEGGELVGKATFIHGCSYLDPETGQVIVPGERAVGFFMHVAQSAEVAVNIKTGQVKTLKLVTAADVGRAINPMNLEGQLQGGIIMGMGSTLYEEMVLDGGRVLNPNFMDYAAPTMTEIPPVGEMKTALVEVHHRDGPYGAKGVGEVAMVATAPAIAQAIRDAVGVRIKSIPITPEKILQAIKSKA